MNDETELLARSIQAFSDERGRYIEEYTTALIGAVNLDNMPPEFAKFVASSWAPSVAERSTPGSIPWEIDFADQRSRVAWERHLEEREEERQRREHAFCVARPQRAYEAAMRATETAAIRAVRSWNTWSKPILVLSGPVGTGKTVACCYHAWAVAKRYRPPRFITATDYVRLSRYDDQRDYYLDAPYLILDDLGSEYADAKGSTSVDFDELINAFYSSPDRCLLVTTNAPLPVFAERYGARVRDRLREVGHVVNVSGPSLRGGGG